MDTEQGSGPGRPEIGGRVTVRLGDDLLAAVDAAATEIRRPELIRRAVAAYLAPSGRWWHPDAPAEDDFHPDWPIAVGPQMFDGSYVLARVRTDGRVWLAAGDGTGSHITTHMDAEDADAAAEALRGAAAAAADIEAAAQMTLDGDR
ncbi:ribbon-helix-helix protein, CopG family [Nocardia sp. NPDC051750]|uniref:ribbon-helix-helix protein, CopG family n=1 Tax=Nocardia sp. NPDC051750 TaxID=3364325 RepID=UPI0037AE6B9E